MTATEYPSIAQQPRENRRFANLGPPGRGQQRHSPAPSQLAQVRQRADPFRLCQFRLVAAAEFLEALRIVAIPLTQLR